jgi:hypothetical protein
LSGVLLVYTTTGVCDRVATMSAVVMRASPGPWVELQTPTFPVAIAQPSAMVSAAPSSRASTIFKPGCFAISAHQVI